MRSNTLTAINLADGTTTQNGASIEAGQLLYLSGQVIVAGGTQGALKLQYSNDIVNPTSPNGAAPVNWSDIPSATATVSGNGVFAIPLTQCCYRQIRAVWTQSNAHAGTVVCRLQVQSV